MKTLMFTLTLFSAAAAIADVCTCGVAPERADDFYWENDKVGFRAYGPGDVHRWSGIDVFNKGHETNEVTRLLRVGGCGAWHNLATLKGGVRTFDNYAVGAGRGCGGVAFWGDGEWKTYANWESSEVLHTGDDYLKFKLVYPAFSAAGKMTCVITQKRGERFFRNDVSFEKDFRGDFRAGPGLDLNPFRGHAGAVREEPGLIAHFEDEKVDGKGNREGSTMAAIFVADPAAVEVRTDAQNCRVLLFKKSRFTYWAGAGWSGTGEIASADDWFAHVKAFREGVRKMPAEASSEDELAARLPTVFARSAAHYRALDAAATPLMRDEKGKPQVPHGWLKWKTGKDALDMRDIYWWTSGHYPGSLWLLHEATGEAFFRDRATAWMELLRPVADYDGNHDVGFMMYCSFGNARRILKTDAYDALLVRTAESLTHRYSDALGLIRSWGKIADKANFLVIPDNMMNLELLEFASRASGKARYAEVARSHATKTMKSHFRSDGGTYHVLDYDQRPDFLGTVQGVRRGQGLSCTTAWSRGQAWAVYGYAMMYRETKDPAYLAFAQKVADYALNHPNMPADGIPYWDFGAPGEERDSSAGAILASGLLELSGLVGGEKGAAYRAFAVKQILALASPAYFSEGGEVGHWLLKHGVGHKPGHSEVDTPLDYGDYYFLEALLRFRNSLEKKERKTK